ncbi:unnamed protein product [Dibothriocephalus latus]|uniref:Uncharacterized protein n=1 Tax=Dibothriocephalus latus TaxID=60516 RepID=A0A3P7LKW3_DIBLA|nr:unnamed protein product [Dibothriocephalus latus]
MEAFQDEFDAPSVYFTLTGGILYMIMFVLYERRLKVFDHHCLWTILRVKCTDFISHKTVRTRCDRITWMSQAIQER